MGEDVGCLCFPERRAASFTSYSDELIGVKPLYKIHNKLNKSGHEGTDRLDNSVCDVLYSSD